MRALNLIDNQNLQVIDIEQPNQPEDDEIQVRILVVALNHLDVWGWRGMAFAKRKLPLTIGAEASGEIVKCGKNVKGFHEGQIVSIFGAKVCGMCQNCKNGTDNLCENVGGIHGFHLDGFARELVNLPERQIVLAPDGCDKVMAALAPITFGTPEHMLYDNAKLTKDETILVHAGGSGIGTAAIQMSKSTGATVITTVGDDSKVKKCQELGADYVINYKNDRFEKEVRKITNKVGVDVVFEHVGADTWEGSMLALKAGGRLVTCGSTSGVSANTNLMMLFQRQLKIIGSFGCTKKNMKNVMAKMAKKEIRPVIDAEVKPDEIQTALKKMQNRNVFGKIIMHIE